MFGDIGKMMKLAGEMKTKLPEMQAKLKETHYTADAGGGVIRATVNGRMQLVEIKFDSQLLGGSPDVALLEDLVKAAVSAAQAKAATAAAEAMRELTGGMSIPGLDSFMA